MTHITPPRNWMARQLPIRETLPVAKLPPAVFEIVNAHKGFHDDTAGIPARRRTPCISVSGWSCWRCLGKHHILYSSQSTS
jgi:hypothetical protein